MPTIVRQKRTPSTFRARLSGTPTVHEPEQADITSATPRVDEILGRESSSSLARNTHANLMLILERRLQILIDDERYQRLASAARARKTSVATIVREAIDAALPVDLERKRAALEEVLGADLVPLPDLPELKRELDDVRAGGR
jgi:hypothetical protein